MNDRREILNQRIARWQRLADSARATADKAHAQSLRAQQQIAEAWDELADLDAEERAAAPAEYRIYHSLRVGYSYAAGDKLWFDHTSYLHPVLADGTVFDRDSVLNRIFERHNRDDRPDGQIAPSLSVGDVVALDWNGDGTTTFYAVERFGWRKVRAPRLDAVVNAGEPLQPFFDALDAHQEAAR